MMPETQTLAHLFGVADLHGAEFGEKEDTY